VVTTAVPPDRACDSPPGKLLVRLRIPGRFRAVAQPHTRPALGKPWAGFFVTVRRVWWPCVSGSGSGGLHRPTPRRPFLKPCPAGTNADTFHRFGGGKDACYGARVQAHANGGAGNQVPPVGTD